MTNVFVPLGVLLILMGSITTLMSLYNLYMNLRFYGMRATPIDRVRSGRVAVRGRVRKNRGPQMRTPVGGQPCVWFRTVLYKKWGRFSEKEVLFSKEKGGDLSLADDTGTIYIRGADAKKILSTMFHGKIGTFHGWPDGFREFVRNNNIPINLEQIGNNTYYLVQEYITPFQEIKVFGHAIGPKKIERGAVRATVPYEITRGEGLFDDLLITNIPFGRRLIAQRGRNIFFLVAGALLIALGIWIALL